MDRACDMICDIRHETCDIRHETCDIRHETCDIRHETCDIRHETCDIRHETCDITGRAEIQSFGRETSKEENKWRSLGVMVQ
jgi:hypothetical protein